MACSRSMNIAGKLSELAAKKAKILGEIAQEEAALMSAASANANMALDDVSQLNGFIIKFYYLNIFFLISFNRIV